MMRNFYQTSTGRSYPYGSSTGTSTSNGNPSNPIRYPSSAVNYSQFSPLTAAGIRQVRFSLDNLEITFFSFLSRTIPYLSKMPIGTTKVSHHFVLIIHQCFIIPFEQCAMNIFSFFFFSTVKNKIHLLSFYFFFLCLCTILFNEIKSYRNNCLRLLLIASSLV